MLTQHDRPRSGILSGCRVFIGNLRTLRLSFQVLLSQASPPCRALGSLRGPHPSPVPQSCRCCRSPRPDLKTSSRAPAAGSCSWGRGWGEEGVPLGHSSPCYLLGSSRSQGGHCQGTSYQSTPKCTLSTASPLSLPC